MTTVPISWQPILITGHSGQVGGALADYLADEPKVMGLSRHGLDLSQPELVYDTLVKHAPKLILNAAAYTAVDDAEEKQALAMRINAESVAEIARYAFTHRAILVHYSTDYVFPGSGTTPWQEDNITAPVNAYGRSKCAGEQAILDAAEKYRSESPRFFIFRTSWVYAAQGKNFLNTMLRLGKEKEMLRVVADQIGAPTFAPDIARITLEVLQKASEMVAFPSGIYHLCNHGETSWHGFAEEIFDLATSLGAELNVREVLPISTAEYPTPAARPLNSRLDCTKLMATFGITLPTWQDGLKRCLLERYEMEKSAAAALHHAQGGK